VYCSFLIKDLKNEQYTRENLDNLYKLLKREQFVGEILWNEANLPKNNECKEYKMIEKIEKYVFGINRKFQRFASDYVHAKFCLNTYEYLENNLLKRNYQYEEIKINDNDHWKIKKILKIEKNDDKPSIKCGIVYSNEKKRQLLVSLYGQKLDLNDYFRDKSDLLKERFNGILRGHIVPQLLACFKFVYDIVNIASEEFYYSISFTGYSNSAWLAEYCLYYLVKFFKFDINNCKAVLFEPPGIVKNIEDFRSNIINKENNEFHFEDLNIVNYLSSPNFNNSSNKHVGKVYRLFIESNYEKDEGFLKKIKKFLNKFDLIKQSRFILNGLYSMTNHNILIKIVQELENIKEENYEEVENWPMIEFKFDNDFDKNLENFLSGSIESVTKFAVDLVPIPIGKNIIAKIASKGISKLSNLNSIIGQFSTSS
jgi:hypothetical protein